MGAGGEVDEDTLFTVEDVEEAEREVPPPLQASAAHPVLRIVGPVGPAAQIGNVGGAYRLPVEKTEIEIAALFTPVIVAGHLVAPAVAPECCASGGFQAA